VSPDCGFQALLLSSARRRRGQRPGDAQDGRVPVVRWRAIGPHGAPTSARRAAVTEPQATAPSSLIDGVGLRWFGPSRASRPVPAEMGGCRLKECAPCRLRGCETFTRTISTRWFGCGRSRERLMGGRCTRLFRAAGCERRHPGHGGRRGRRERRAHENLLMGSATGRLRPSRPRHTQRARRPFTIHNKRSPNRRPNDTLPQGHSDAAFNTDLGHLGCGRDDSAASRVAVGVAGRPEDVSVRRHSVRP
jgi:hypothetical protein